MSPTGTLQFLMLNRCGVNSVKYIYGKISPMSNENPFVKTIFFSNFGSNQVNRCNDMALIRLYIYIRFKKKGMMQQDLHEKVLSSLLAS